MSRELLRLPVTSALLVPLALWLLVSCARAGEGNTASQGKAPSSAVLAAPATAPAPAAPDDPYARITLQDVQGRAIRMADYRGKVRLIDVWASWCGPCRMIIPHLNRLADQYRGQGLVVIGVSVDSSPADVVAFTSKVPIRYPVGMMNPDVAALLGDPDAIPTSYLVDRKGKLRRKFVGYVEPQTIEREVRKFLESR